MPETVGANSMTSRAPVRDLPEVGPPAFESLEPARKARAPIVSAARQRTPNGVLHTVVSAISGTTIGCLLLLSLVSLPAHALKRVALIIGVSSYTKAPLKNPVNDARAVSKQLSSLGFQVTRVENPTRNELEQAIVDFEARLGPDTAGLFYFAGHGMQVRGKNYLVPADADIDSERQVRVQAVDLGLVTSAMEYAKSRVNFIVLDACRNNPFERSVRGNSRGLAAVDAAGGTLIAYATAPGSVAEDGDGRNGVYTGALLEALSKPGLKAEEVFKHVRVNVARDTARRQIPWESSSLTGDFVFNQSGRPAPPRSAQDGNSIELGYWNSIQNSNSPEAYRSYLKRFPNGNFVELAELKLEGERAKASARSASRGVTCPALSGSWRQTLPECESTFQFAPEGNGKFKFSESGCGNATGTAVQRGREVRIDWTIPFCSGYIELTLDETCDTATGEVVMPANFLACSGRLPSTIERVR